MSMVLLLEVLEGNQVLRVRIYYKFVASLYSINFAQYTTGSSGLVSEELLTARCFNSVCRYARSKLLRQ